MSAINLVATTKSASGQFALPASKSISNRLLIMRALTGDKLNVKNISEADDTAELQKCLLSENSHINAGNGGTTSRFLLAYLAFKLGVWILDCGEQMKHRSIYSLVEALMKLGANINYLGDVGYFPVKIEGGGLQTRQIELDVNISSQYVSAIALIAPYLPAGLDIQLTGNVVSQSYIKMTTVLMKQCGADVEVVGNRIIVKSGSYKNIDINVEPDWSAAAFAYELAAFSGDPNILMPGLFPSGLQGDNIVADIFHYFKVRTTFKNEGAYLTAGKERTPKQRINLRSIPDMAPSILVTCAGLGIEAEVWGLAHLKHKESNRIDALRKNLENLGVKVEADSDSLAISGQAKPGDYLIETFDDHRIAMAFAPLVLKNFNLTIDNAECVRKSFPRFWTNLEELGIGIISTS